MVVKVNRSEGPDAQHDDSADMDEIMDDGQVDDEYYDDGDDDGQYDDEQSQYADDDQGGDGEGGEDTVESLKAEVKQLTGMVKMMGGGQGAPGGMMPMGQQQQPQESPRKVTAADIMDGLDFEGAAYDPQALSGVMTTMTGRVLEQVDGVLTRAEQRAEQRATEIYSETQRAADFYDQNPELDNELVKPLVAETYGRIMAGYATAGYRPTQEQVLEETAQKLKTVIAPAGGTTRRKPRRKVSAGGRHQRRRRPTLPGAKSGRRKAAAKSKKGRNQQQDMMAELLE